jgi:hypothetical protein
LQNSRIGKRDDQNARKNLLSKATDTENRYDVARKIAMNDQKCDPEKCLPAVLFDCDYVFGEPVVLPVREGGTMVQWELDSRVRDEGEYHFSLQTGNAGVDDPDAWETILTEKDVFYLVDPVRRLPGVFAFTHYRLRLQTDERTYHSRPLHTMGRLRYEDWRVYVAVLRAEQIQLARKTGIEGFLYKRKISGRPCSRCLDFNTGEVTDAGCQACFGTGWLGGYFRPVPCSCFDLQPNDTSIRHDIPLQGPVTNTRFEARAVASPLLASGDLWLNCQNSERYRIMQVRPIVEQKGVPIVYALGIERLPFSDIAYSLSRGD